MNRDPVIGQIEEDETRMEGGDSGSTEGNIQQPIPSTGLAVSVDTTTASGHVGVSGTQMEGGYCWWWWEFPDYWENCKNIKPLQTES